MSNRYELAVISIDDEECIQLFGNNEYLEELHEFAYSVDNTIGNKEWDTYFEVELNANDITKLYNIVDEICLGINEQNPMTFDLDKLYSRYKNSSCEFSFGESILSIIDGSCRQMQSAFLYMFIIRSKGLDSWHPRSIAIKDCYKVLFSYN